MSSPKKNYYPRQGTTTDGSPDKTEEVIQKMARAGAFKKTTAPTSSPTKQFKCGKGSPQKGSPRQILPCVAGRDSNASKRADHSVSPKKK